ncbi:MAG: PEP-CTERM sorting domain-containing protein [Desulfobacca sp.]|nr:PEP-CTERM sorting domain-containing protein [Desulfobacca sp.]
MKKIPALMLAVFLVLGLSLAASANLIGPGQIMLQIGQDTKIVDMAKVVIDDKEVYNLASAFSNGGGASIQLNGLANPDPAIAWGLTAINPTANPLNFGFVVAIPIALGPGPTTVNASISGGLTDFTGNAVTIAPFNQTDIQVNFANGFTWGVGPAQTSGPGNPGALYVYGAHIFGPAAGPNGPLAVFGETVSFTLTGHGDIASLTGYCQINPVPLPATLFLMGGGVLGLVLVGRRRKKS